jgi:hypothetical protein
MMPNPWLTTVCDVPWCLGFDPANPHFVGDDLDYIQWCADTHGRDDVWKLAADCKWHAPEHQIPGGPIVHMEQHKEFVAFAREAATGPDPEFPGEGADWEACIEALGHEGAGGGDAIEDDEYTEMTKKFRDQRWNLLLAVLERRRKGFELRKRKKRFDR